MNEKQNRSNEEMKGSWGDTIREYEQSKKLLPWETMNSQTSTSTMLQNQQQLNKMNLMERKAKENEMNPILMKFKDTNKEDTFQQTELLNTLNKKPSKGPSRPYNIITHSNSNKDKKEYTRIHRNTRDYNLLSHLNTKFHTVVPLEYNEDYIKQLQTKKNLPVKEHFRSRDFNILSNKYLSNNEMKQLEDNLKLNQVLNEKYWKTHIYDPIKVQNYDLQQEEQYQRQAEKKIIKDRSQQEEMFPKW